MERYRGLSFYWSHNLEVLFFFGRKVLNMASSQAIAGHTKKAVTKVVTAFFVWPA